MAHQHNLHRRRSSADGFHRNLNLKLSSPSVSDCGSTLYDSYELSTFTQHLQRAIAADGPLQSSSIIKDRHARSLSMPHFAFTPTVIKEEEELMADIDFCPLSTIEPLNPKNRGRLRVPKLVQRLFTRLAREGEKKHDLHSKVGTGRSSFERVLYTAVHYC